MTLCLCPVCLVSSGWLMVFLAKKEASGNSQDYLHRICTVMSHMLSEPGSEKWA